MLLLLVDPKQASSAPKAELEQKYHALNAAILKSDLVGVTDWVKSNCTKDFAYASYQKNVYKFDGYLAELSQEIQSTSRVTKSTMTVRTVEPQGSDYLVTVVTEFQGVVNVDARKMTLTDASVTQDTWRKIGPAWKFVKSVQVNTDTQMHEGE